MLLNIIMKITLSLVVLVLIVEVFKNMMVSVGSLIMQYLLLLKMASIRTAFIIY